MVLKAQYRHPIAFPRSPKNCAGNRRPAAKDVASSTRTLHIAHCQWIMAELAGADDRWDLTVADRVGSIGVLEFLLGNLQPWIFALSILPASIAGSCVRPPSANLMLEQQKGNAGSVSSLMSCVGLLMGSLGMLLISFN